VGFAFVELLPFVRIAALFGNTSHRILQSLPLTEFVAPGNSPQVGDQWSVLAVARLHLEAPRDFQIYSVLY
jgi:hypothetical protein